MEYGLVGERLGHSYSPEIHRLLWGGEYELRELKPEELDGFMKRREFRGINVTIPYKKAVLPYCVELSESARAIGSVNTVINRDGRLYGYNTDFDGMEYLISRSGIEIAGKNVLLLGSGGTSLTARAVCGALGARSVTVASRTGEVNYNNIYGLSETELIINTTPVGMFPNNGGCPADITRFPGLAGVLDVVYNPLKTRLIQQAEELGVPASGGLVMLAAQAAAGAELFTDRPFPAGSVERVYCALLREKANIVLVGMPGSGKSSIGGRAAELMGRPFVDMDTEIERAAGMPVPEIFAKFGEERFRQLETEMAEKVGRETGLVIATGGGVVKRGQNRLALRQNGRVYHIRRSLELLPLSGRPLSASREALAAMERERLPLYRAFCDAEIENGGSIEEAAGRITEDFNAYFGDKRA